jgi:hypothetical protein
MVQNQAMAAQMQAQQQAQDPTIQMQQAELQLKEKEIDRKEADSLRDFQIAQGKLKLEQARIAEAQKNKGDDPRLKAIMAQQDMIHKEQAHQQKMRQRAQQAAQREQQQRAAQSRPKSKE